MAKSKKAPEVEKVVQPVVVPESKFITIVNCKPYPIEVSSGMGEADVFMVPANGKQPNVLRSSVSFPLALGLHWADQTEEE